MSKVTAEFKEAVLEEDLSMIDDMLENFVADGGKARQKISEYTVRKMLIKRKYLANDIERQKAMRDAVKAEWDRRIESSQNEMKVLENLVNSFVEENIKNGKPLKLDVATLGHRAVNHSVKVSDSEKFKSWLQSTGMDKQFLKEPVLDETAAKNHLLAVIDNSLKVAKEKGASEEELADLEAKWIAELPPGVEYQKPTKALNIRMNI